MSRDIEIARVGHTTWVKRKEAILPRVLFALATALAVVPTLSSAATPEATPVQLLVDGRPVRRTAALVQGGVYYVELGGMVRVFNGLVLFEKSTATVSIGSRVAIFTVGSARANLDGTMLGTGGKTFERQGDWFVPLSFFATRLAHAAIHVAAGGKSIEVTSLSHGAGIATPSPQPDSM